MRRYGPRPRRRDDEAFATSARELLDGVPVVRDLLILLHAVARREADNAMTPENLAICWAPNVFVLDPDSCFGRRPATGHSINSAARRRRGPAGLVKYV